MLRFYTQQHKHYCGIELQAKAMYVCILDQHGTKRVHKHLPTTPAAFLRIIAPYRADMVVGVEGIFTWYGLADLCQQEGLTFVLGHALPARPRCTRAKTSPACGPCRALARSWPWSFSMRSRTSHVFRACRIASRIVAW